MEFRMSYKILKVQHSTTILMFSKIFNDKTSLVIQSNFERLIGYGTLDKDLKFNRIWNMQ